MPVDTVAGTIVLRYRVAIFCEVTASGMCYCSNIRTVGTLGLCPLTQLLATTLWRLRVANVCVVTASGMSYCSNILTVATLGLCLLTQLLAEQCGVFESGQYLGGYCERNELLQ